MKRQHPAALLGYTTKNFWLLLIPLIRGLAALKFDFYRWSQGAGWDILAVTAMIAIAVIRWYYTLYEFSEDGISVKTGMVMKYETKIPCLNVSAVTGEENPVLARFGAVKVYIDTDAASGGKANADVSLMVYKEDRAKLFNILSAAFRSPENRGDKREKTGSGMNFTYKASAGSLIAFSVLFSSALSGVALLMTALSGSTDIIGDRLEKDFFKAVNDVSDAVTTLAGRLISGISPAGTEAAPEERSFKPFTPPKYSTVLEAMMDGKYKSDELLSDAPLDKAVDDSDITVNGRKITLPNWEKITRE